MVKGGNVVGHARRLAAAILVVASGVVIDTSRAASWSPVNTGLPSAAVNVNAVAIVPAQSSTIYARTTSADGTGGIFKTTDGAGSWKAISNVVGVYSLAVDPQTPATIYVITRLGILKSTDGGESWVGAGAGLQNTYVSLLIVDPVSSSKLYAVTGNGIFKSTDGAASWNLLDTGLPPNTYITSIVIDPANPSRIYATGSFFQTNGAPTASLLRSTDEGQSWKIIDLGLGPNSSIGSLTISSTSVLYAIAGTSILKSADGGDHWTALDAGLPSGADIASLIVDPTNSSTLYLAVDFGFAEAGGILKSSDGGATWNAIKADLPANTPIDYLAIDPAASSTLYAISNSSLLKSTDAGVSWAESSTGLTAISTNALAVNRLDASVYAGAGNSVVKSVDGGASWSQLAAFQLFASNTPTFVPSFFADGQAAYPVTLLLDPINPDNLYASTIRGNGCYFADNLLFKSTDGGMNWDNSISPQDSGCVLGPFFAQSAGLKAIDPTDPKTLYVAEADDGDGYWSLLRSRDGGASWSSVGDFLADLQTGVWTLAIDPTTPTTLYAGLDDVPFYDMAGTGMPGTGGVFKSTDGGTTWAASGLSGGAVTLLTIDPTQPNVLYAVTEGDYGTPRGFRGIFKSTDAGATWTEMDHGLEGLLATGSNIVALVMDPANSNTLYAGVSGSGVFKSSDAGASWSTFNSGLGNLDVRVLAPAPGSGHTLYAGTSGGVFRIDDVD